MNIVCAHWTRTTRKFIMPLLRALTSLGHTVRIFGSQPLDVLRNAETDLYITTSTELKHAVRENKAWLLEQTGKPYVTLWFQTPLRNLSTLKKLTSPLHRAMFIPDSSDVAEL
ncbi:MAG: hypothetical protein IT388_01450, partial [Nitrospirales bacterium]|nr:hypothetical protein [Nitrospirales bacterium]